MKIQLNFCGLVCVNWHLYLQSVHSVSVDLAMRSRQVSLWLVIYWPWDYIAILDGRSIFTYVWNWLYNIIVIEFITKTWCKEQFCELNREFRCLVMRIPVDNIYNFVMLTKVYKIVPLPTCSSSSEYVGYQSINLDLMFKVN